MLRTFEGSAGEGGAPAPFPPSLFHSDLDIDRVVRWAARRRRTYAAIIIFRLVRAEINTPVNDTSTTRSSITAYIYTAARYKTQI